MALLFRHSFFRWILLFSLSISTANNILLAADNKQFVVTPKILENIAEKAAQKAVEKVLEQTQEKASSSNLEKPIIIKENNSAKEATTKTQLMNIGSGSIGGNYFVLGELVGGVISHPTGSLPCNEGGTCGVPNLQTLNLTSAGSMANLLSLKDKRIASGFVQSDVAYWAYTGTGLFETKEKMSDLRAIASLYPEAIHIVINKSASIKSVPDLKGKRVSVGAKNSGTLLQARLVLKAYDINEDDLKTEYLNNQQSIRKLVQGELDAMFFSVGVPAPSLTQLFASGDFSLLPINQSAQQKIFKQGSYFSPYTIKSDVYPNISETKTISVFALWLCLANQDTDFIYEITKALWDDTSRQLLDSSAIGKKVTIENSLHGIGIPLHEGAKKYYNEIGKRY